MNLSVPELIGDDVGVPAPPPSAVVIPTPGVEPIVSRWRDRLDPSAAAGMPSHITLLFPFLPESHLTAEVEARLRAICFQHEPIAVQFSRVARFPGVLYLAPDPADELRALTLAIAERWPETPPYAGAHDDVIPHLTVAMAEDAVLDAVEPELAAQLPVETRLPQAALFTFDGRRWRIRAPLPFSRVPLSPLLEAGISLTEFQAADVDAVLLWRYPAEYGVYDLRPEDQPKLAEAGSRYFAIRRGRELVGFVCTGTEARVPGLQEDPSVTDIGVGMRPDLTGQRASRALMPAIIAGVERHLATSSFRAAIAAWNLRAQRAAEHAGFRPTAEHRNDHGTYVLLIRDPTASPSATPG